MAWQKDMAWRRLDEKGQERCIFVCAEALCGLEGLGAVAINGSGLVFEYRMQLTPAWDLRQASIVAHLGDDEFALNVEHREDGSWLFNGALAAEYTMCTDIDLSFSPSTNTMAIKRLNLAVGQEGASRAVYVSEPELKLSVLDQLYRRVDQHRYEYSTGDFTGEIEVDDEGIVQKYLGLFEPISVEQMAGVSG